MWKRLFVCLFDWLIDWLIDCLIVCLGIIRQKVEFWRQVITLGAWLVGWSIFFWGALFLFSRSSSCCCCCCCCCHFYSLSKTVCNKQPPRVIPHPWLVRVEGILRLRIASLGWFLILVIKKNWVVATQIFCILPMGQTVYLPKWRVDFYSNFQWLGGFNQIFYFHPDPWGDENPICRLHLFQMGWNHRVLDFGSPDGGMWSRITPKKGGSFFLLKPLN